MDTWWKVHGKRWFAATHCGDDTVEHFLQLRHESFVTQRRVGELCLMGLQLATLLRDGGGACASHLRFGEDEAGNIRVCALAHLLHLLRFAKLLRAVEEGCGVAGKEQLDLRVDEPQDLAGHSLPQRHPHLGTLLPATDEPRVLLPH